MLGRAVAWLKEGIGCHEPRRSAVRIVDPDGPDAGTRPSGAVKVHSTEYFIPNGDLVVFAITFQTGCANNAASKAVTLSWLKP